ncbi:MAG: ATP synthase F1 subunit delta [Thermodesulfobacteriota bacterium]
MISQTLARRYATALLALGREDGHFAKYGKELGEFAGLLAETGLDVALTNPLYPADSRRQVLVAVLAKMGLSKMVENFILLLQDKGRISQTGPIYAYYQRLVDEVNNIQRAALTTAAPVSPELKDQVKAALEKMTGKQIIIEANEDPGLIGGIITQVGDLTMDGSLKTQLKNLKESLIKG